MALATIHSTKPLMVRKHYLGLRAPTDDQEGQEVTVAEAVQSLRRTLE